MSDSHFFVLLLCLFFLNSAAEATAQAEIRGKRKKYLFYLFLIYSQEILWKTECCAVRPLPLDAIL